MSFPSPNQQYQSIERSIYISSYMYKCTQTHTKQQIRYSNHHHSGLVGDVAVPVSARQVFKYKQQMTLSKFNMHIVTRICFLNDQNIYHQTAKQIINQC